MRFSYFLYIYTVATHYNENWHIVWAVDREAEYNWSSTKKNVRCSGAAYNLRILLRWEAWWTANYIIEFTPSKQTYAQMMNKRFIGSSRSRYNVFLKLNWTSYENYLALSADLLWEEFKCFVCIAFIAS